MENKSSINKLFQEYIQSDEYQAMKFEENADIDKSIAEFMTELPEDQHGLLKDKIDDLAMGMGLYYERFGFRNGFRYAFKLASEALGE